MDLMFVTEEILRNDVNSEWYFKNSASDFYKPSF